MNAFPLRTSFSLVSFPVGLGLAAAAHAHLCRQGLVITNENRRYCLYYQTLSQLEHISQTLVDLNSLSELIKVVDSVLQRFPERQRSHHRSHRSARSKRKREFKGTKAHAESKDRNCTRNAAKLSSTGRSRDDNGSGATNKGSKGKEVAVVMSDDQSRSRSQSQSQEETNETNDMTAGTRSGESSSGSKHPKIHHRSRQPKETRRTSKKTQTADVSADDLEQFSRTYKALRQTQEVYMKLVFQRMHRADPSIMKLTSNAVFSSLLGGFTMFRYVISTEKFAVFYAKCTSWLPSLGSLSTWRFLSPPRSSVIPWGLAPPSSGVPSRSDHGAGILTIGGAWRATGPLSNTPVIFAFLPLVPTLVVSGMHFLAAAMTHWTVRGVQKHIRREQLYARRLSIVSTFIMIREKRLLWLAREIRNFEEVEREKLAEEEYEDVDDGCEDDDSIEAGAPSTSSTASPPSAASEPRVRPQPPSQDLHNRVYSLLHSRPAESSLGRHRDQGNVNDSESDSGSSNRNNQTEGQQGSGQSSRRSTIDPKQLPYTFGPDLERMDLPRFLNDRTERRRILMLELEAMHSELQMFLCTLN
ncbi:hypothetical protein EDD21DRAFT_141470 [Dissophora ornata]|nr:hypothetical protein EDD21DRAFT_141470 [Dissophora ornata]